MAPLVLMSIFVAILTSITSTTAHSNNLNRNLSKVSTVTPVIQYHVGPVMSLEMTVYIIWYGNFRPQQKRIIRDFINSISATQIRSPSVSDWWKTVQLYTDQTNANVTGKVSVGTERHDKLMSQGRNLTRLSLQSVINTAITAKSKPLPIHHKGGLYLILTAEDILVQDFCHSICSVHFFTFPSIVGYTLPFAWVGNPKKQCPDLCAFPYAAPFFQPNVKPVKPPNGDLGIDAMVGIIAHNLAELGTNPLDNTWYTIDEVGFREVSDLCDGIYGKGGRGYPDYIGNVKWDKSGAAYNMYGINRRFLVPWVWNHVESRCSGGYM